MLSLPASEVFVWYVAFGEAHGGEWDYQEHKWETPPQPDAVYSIEAEIKK